MTVALNSMYVNETNTHSYSINRKTKNFQLVASSAENKLSTRSADELLIDETLKGTRGAFDYLVIRYQSRIMSVIASYVRDRDVIADIAQEAFIRAYRGLSRFKRESSFYTWLYRIAANTSLHHLSKEKRRPYTMELDDSGLQSEAMLLMFSEGPEQITRAEELQLRLSEVLEQLPIELKTALLLREHEGLRYNEIADIVGCPVGTIRSRIFRARDIVSNKLSVFLDDPDVNGMKLRA